MKTNQELFNERLNRIMTAATLGTPDQIPVLLTMDSFSAKHIGVKMADFIKDPTYAAEVILKSAVELGGVDGLQCLFAGTAHDDVFPPWLTRMKLPGKALGDDELWQVDENEAMKPEDYDEVIKKGFRKFCTDIVVERLGGTGNELMGMAMATPAAAQNAVNAGIVPFSTSVGVVPYETFCGGRTMAKFMRDLYKMPEKVQEAMDVAMVDILAEIEMICKMGRPLSVWIGGWRTASQFLSQKLWDRFVWPYFKQVTEAYIKRGVIPILHMDSDWERDLARFRDLPKGKFIFSTDGSTNLYKVKEVLGDHCCIMGDVPPSLLSLATPDEVYNYSRKLINDLGPSGYILSQGCCIPPNAKVENVKAMIAAATGK